MKPSGQVAEVEHTMGMIVVESEYPRLAERGLGPKRTTGRTKGPQRLCTCDCDCDASIPVSSRRRCPSSSESALRIRPSPLPLGKVPFPAVPVCSTPIWIAGPGSGFGSVVCSYPYHAHHDPSSDPRSPTPSTGVSPLRTLFVRRKSLASDD
jgi:hypothetical protein